MTLTAETKRQLWAESGGYCQKPDCATYLFSDPDQVHYAEMAHIVAATTGGPRDVTQKDMSSQDRASAFNIVVLCANCHSIVDKNPQNYPTELMRQWKTRHQQALQQALGTPIFQDRSTARSYIESRLDDNHIVFRQYGPTNDDLSEDKAYQWRQLAVSRIVPNNAEIARVLQANRHLLTPTERTTMGEFIIHQNQFAARHIFNDNSTCTMRYPERMDEIFEETF